MAHFAQLDENNVVREVVVVANDDVENLPFPESEPVGIAFLNSVLPGNTWAQTSYNNNFRVRYAILGGTFVPDTQASAYGGFLPPKPYPSWIYVDADCSWTAPVPYPDDGGNYYWDEQTLSWVRIPLPTPPSGDIPVETL